MPLIYKRTPSKKIGNSRGVGGGAQMTLWKGNSNGVGGKN